jgi:nucleotide-binding universal stress UspA family protein
MKVVLGTDFSENARAAGMTAAALASRWGDTLAIAHVLDDSVSRRLPGDVRETLAAFTSDRLHSEAAQLGSDGVKVEEHMLSGAPEQALANLATQSNARLVVVSSLGHRPIEWLLGSVAERTAEFSLVPTLVVRSAAPFEAWVRGEKPLRVFVAVDFSNVSDKALKWVKHLVDAGPCEVVVGYVDWPLGEAARLGITGQLLLGHNPTQVQRILERELSERAGALLGEGVTRIRVEPSIGRADLRLVEMALEEEADLIVAGSHQRHGLGRIAHPSISRGLLRNAPMSVACIPAARVEKIERQSAPIRRVLAASDLSEHGGRAIPYAYGAVCPGGIVRLLHVFEPLEASALMEKPSVEVVAEADERLRAQVPSDAAVRGIQTEVAVIEAGDVAKTIRQEAERFGAHLICIGSHGRSGLAKAVLGSVAQSIMVQSQRPVLIVRKAPP